MAAGVSTEGEEMCGSGFVVSNGSVSSEESGWVGHYSNTQVIVLSIFQSCRLKKLPHVLTFGLLRFLYNFQKGERCKVREHCHVRKVLPCKEGIAM